jgi:hypothetical protein
MATVETRRQSSVTCYVPAEFYKQSEARDVPLSTNVALWLIVAGVWLYDLVLSANHLVG